MKPLKSQLLLLSSAFLLEPLAVAQVAPNSPPPSQSDVTGPAAGTQRSRPPSENEILHLNPFEVQADSDTSYGAVNSNSLTRFKTQLNELPATADVFNQTFMDDVGATSVEDLVKNYSAGGGFSTSDPATDAANVEAGDRQATSSVTIRGLMSPSLRRDGFIQLGSLTNPGSTGSAFTTNFDIERVEVIEGPQSLLYGSGGGGGVLNTVSKQARFDQGPFGSIKFSVDQYGHKLEQYDAGMSAGHFAVRVAALHQQVGGRRVNIGGPLTGYYAQIAGEIGQHTIVRFTASQTVFDRLYNTNLTLTALSAANDSRNGQNLNYLLATNQINAAANGGPSGAGALTPLNLANADSFAGWDRTERSKNEYVLSTVDTTWARWLSTEISAGYNNFEDRLKSSGGGAFVAPNVAANPTGTFASNSSSATNWKPTRTTTLRFAAVATNDLFDDRAHSQTMFGADWNRSRQTSVVSSLYKADANGNIIGSGSTRSVIAAQYYPIAGGPVQNPYWDPFAKEVTIAGVNYVQALDNTVNPALISPSDPLGVTIGGAVYQFTTERETGIYLVNYTKWMSDKLTTMLGARYDNSDLHRDWATSAPLDTQARKVDFNVGANYALLNWLRPYFGVSSSFNPPLEQGIGPDGTQVQTAHAIGGEVGVKLQNADGRFSGSVAYYYLNSKNENQRIQSAFVGDINPVGLNGANGAASTWANIDRQSTGIQGLATYAPTRNWRMRLAAAVTDGTVGSTHRYGQFYNDQFYANAQGQVTYADGTVVYVPATPNSTVPTVPPTTAGAIPLTIGLMNSSASPYYANPTAITGAINKSSAVARVLMSPDPVHGSILTGRTGLPISAIQITPSSALPGIITTSEAGDSTTGYSKYSLNLTSLYTFPTGWVKGLRLGGTVSLGWQNRGFIYYPTGTAVGAQRVLFDWPDTRQFNGIVGYSRRFGRISFSTQLNISNVFNRYEVVIVPNATTGWAGPNNAALSAEPRAYVWTNTFSF